MSGGDSEAMLPCVPVTLFDACLEEIVTIMENDSFPRFKSNSAVYKEYLSSDRSIEGTTDIFDDDDPPPAPPSLKDAALLSSYDGQSYDGKSVRSGSRGLSRSGSRRRNSASQNGDQGDSVVVWQYTGQLKPWDTYDDDAAAIIEEAYMAGKPSVMLKVKQQLGITNSKAATLHGSSDVNLVEYKVVLKNRSARLAHRQLSQKKQSNYMYQQNTVTGFERQVRRVVRKAKTRAAMHEPTALWKLILNAGIEHDGFRNSHALLKVYQSIGGLSSDEIWKAAYSAPDLAAMKLRQDQLHLDIDQPRDPNTGATQTKSAPGASKGVPGADAVPAPKGPEGGAKALEEKPGATASKGLGVTPPFSNERVKGEIEMLSVEIRLACALIRCELGGSHFLGTTAMLEAMGSVKGSVRGGVKDGTDKKQYEGPESGPQLASALFLGLGKVPLIVTSPLAGKKKPLTINAWKQICKADPLKEGYLDALRPLFTDGFIQMYEDTDPVNSEVGDLLLTRKILKFN